MSTFRRRSAPTSGITKFGFEALITCGKNVRTQQNLSGRKIALVVVSTNHWPTIRPCASKVAAKVDFVQRGQLLLIDVADID